MSCKVFLHVYSDLSCICFAVKNSITIKFINITLCCKHSILKYGLFPKLTTNKNVFRVASALTEIWARKLPYKNVKYLPYINVSCVFILRREQVPFFQVPLAPSTKQCSATFRVHASGERSKLLAFVSHKKYLNWINVLYRPFNEWAVILRLHTSLRTNLPKDINSEMSS
jgi:hypothetical protein